MMCFIERWGRKDYMDKVTYLLDSGYKEVLLYEINHTNKTMKKYSFSCLMDCENFIIENDCFPLVFYGLGYLSFIWNEFKRYGYNISMDYEIYEWRMRLPINIKQRTTVGYYYEMQGYTYYTNTNIKIN